MTAVLPLSATGDVGGEHAAADVRSAALAAMMILFTARAAK
jgi:hypothetical protein